MRSDDQLHRTKIRGWPLRGSIDHSIGNLEVLQIALDIPLILTRRAGHRAVAPDIAGVYKYIHGEVVSLAMGRHGGEHTYHQNHEHQQKARNLCGRSNWKVSH